MEVLKSVPRKLRRALQGRGVLGTVGVGLRYLRGVGRGLTRSRRRALRADQAFDLAHGLDTSGVIPLSELDVPATSWLHGNAYQATGPDVFDAMMGALDVSPGDFVFADLGSGKGRCLWLAARYPFRKIIGVELARELHERCVDNLRRGRVEGRRCADLEPVHGDAATWEPPLLPLVVYLYNPFEEPILRAVVDNLVRSLTACPRPMRVIYYNPRHRELFDRAPLFERLHQRDDWVMWRARPGA